MRRILLLDDEINVLHALQRSLRTVFQKETQFELFTDPELALHRLAEVSFDVVLSDYWMPGINGIEFLKLTRSMQPDAVRLILSASKEFDTVMKATNQAEVFRFIPKPWLEEEIKQIFLLALDRRDQALEERGRADEVRHNQNQLSPQEIEAHRLEKLEPGITRVNWGADGSVYLSEEK